MNNVMTTIFGLLGGLAVFIYGMNMMSESLQKVAGEKMKSILEVLTKNPIMGVLAGAIVTTVLQSSSATTVLVIGFVGFFIFFIAKNEKIKFMGQTIFAFGLLFVGIETMGGVMKPLAGSPIFVDLMGKVANVPVLGVVLGAVMTMVVQSSSATIAVLQSFASQSGPDGVTSVIGLTGAIPILLGDNIGTTITALLASVGQPKNAKRAAVAHSVFNITGSFVFIWLVKPFAVLVRVISPKGAELAVIARQIANAHMSFNIMFSFSNAAVKELAESITLAENMFVMALEAVQSDNREKAMQVLQQRKELHNMGKKFGKNHLKRLKKNNCKPELTYAFSTILHNLERLGDSCGNIAEETMDNMSLVSLPKELSV